MKSMQAVFAEDSTLCCFQYWFN